MPSLEKIGIGAPLGVELIEADLPLEKPLFEYGNAGCHHSIGPIRRLPFTFIDLFAGIGGLRLGAEKVGGSCVFSSEWDRHCQKTYKGAVWLVEDRVG